MTDGKIDHLIINSPYEEPKLFWKRDERTGEFFKENGRRPAGYVAASPEAQSVEELGRFIPIELVGQIRPRIKKWREEGYPGVTGITKKLLEHWHNPEVRIYRLFFCQLDAIETLIWLTEAPASSRTGITVPVDGGPFSRYCSKMATGSGKTIVMAMLIAWQALNKVADPQNPNYSKNFLVVAPSLTVRHRLQVLIPSHPENYYQEFNLLPLGYKEKLNQAKVQVINWHALLWESEKDLAKKKSVDKRGPMSDSAYTRDVLKELGNAENIVVINDEAHHAWRASPDINLKGVAKIEKEKATIWIGGLDRIHKVRRIMSAYDFSATPFVSFGRVGAEENLFGWIVSDFGLNDAIESGLVKTPRVVIRDDAWVDKENKSRLYRIYQHVKDDLNRPETAMIPLPDLVTAAYTLLGKDWQVVAKEWEESNATTPPVMITVANRTETAARVKYAFDHNKIFIEGLCDPDNTVHIDSKVLETIEEEDIEIEQIDTFESKTEESEDEIVLTEHKKTKRELALELREIVNTVGKPGKPGAMVKNVISVGMLTEGWDARTVTHIMGLRAFTSQLLCEQVVGRGLRRTEYEVNETTGLFKPEYVNIFGVPFTFLPHEEDAGGKDGKEKPKFVIQPIAEKSVFEITFPNVLRVEQVLKPTLTLNPNEISVLILDAYATPTLAQMAPVVDGKADFSRMSEINLEELGKKFRIQKIAFEAARDIYEREKPNWKGNKEYLLGQLIALVEKYLNSGRIQFNPPMFYQDEFKQRILIALNMGKVVQHIWEAIRFKNSESLDIVLDGSRPIRSTGDMSIWYTSKPSEFTKKSHINRAVFDSSWEATEAYELERNENVVAWVKNDHLGYSVYYVYQGVPHTYYPDFLIKLNNGMTLVLEVKGVDDQRNRTKREFLDEWVKAVNAHGGFGRWAWAVSKNPADLKEIIQTNSKED